LAGAAGPSGIALVVAQETVDKGKKVVSAVKDAAEDTAESGSSGS
jgi:hypothetical protein